MPENAFAAGRDQAMADYKLATAMKLCCAIASYDRDPPDSSFQHGHLEGLYRLLARRLAPLFATDQWRLLGDCLLLLALTMTIFYWR